MLLLLLLLLLGVVLGDCDEGEEGVSDVAKLLKLSIPSFCSVLSLSL